MTDEVIDTPVLRLRTDSLEEMIYLDQDPRETCSSSPRVDLTVTAIHSRKLNFKRPWLRYPSALKDVREAEITTDIDSDTPLYKRQA